MNGRLHTEEQRRIFRAARAEEMKLWPTRAEQVAWAMLETLGFHRQVVFETPRYSGIMDFFCERAKLCVEIDGPVHRRQKGRDGRRDRALAALGIRTIRVKNSVVLKTPALFREQVARALKVIEDVEDTHGE
jgi:very-short-patch-repair endonuclease